MGKFEHLNSFNTKESPIEGDLSGLGENVNAQVQKTISKKTTNLGKKVDITIKEKRYIMEKRVSYSKKLSQSQASERVFGKAFRGIISPPKKTNKNIGKKRQASSPENKSTVRDPAKFRHKAKENYNKIQEDLKDTSSDTYLQVKKRCEAHMGREANQEDIDVYSIESGILEKIAMDQTIAELIDAGWTEQEIIEGFQNEAEQYLDDDEKKIFQEYIYDLVHDLFVYHTYETNLNKALKTTTPGASLAYSDMVKYGELKNISIQVSSLSTQDIIFLTKHPKSDFMKHIQENYPQERNILYNTPQEKRNDEAYTQAVYNINQSRKQYMGETLTDQARISTFNTIYHNKKSLVQQSDSNLFDSKTTYIQHTNKGLESSIHISGGSDIYTQQLLQQEDKISIPSLTGKDKTIDIPTVSTKTTRVSTRQALAGTAPIQKPKTETRHKETTQKYLYQECILTEVCNAIQLHDNTRSIDTIANIHRPILTIIDQALSNLQPNQLKSILKLVSSDARQHSMAASELPLTLTPHQAKISPVANNMARFWGKYIGKKKGNLETKETETKPESLNISYNDIHDKINQRNKAVTITNTMEENIDKQILRGYIDQDIALEKTKGSDIYAVKTA